MKVSFLILVRITAFSHYPTLRSLRINRNLIALVLTPAIRWQVDGKILCNNNDEVRNIKYIKCWYNNWHRVLTARLIQLCSVSLALALHDDVFERACVKAFGCLNNVSTGVNFSLKYKLFGSRAVSHVCKPSLFL
jgi:hypothetical protein